MAEENAQVPATGNTETAENEPVLNPAANAETPAAGSETKGNAKSVPENAEEEPILNPEETAGADENIGAPESYGDFTLPAGFTLDDDGKKQAAELFRGLNLSQKGGQKLIDAFTERVTAMREAELNALAEKRRQWRAEIRQRPTFASDRALAMKGMNAVVRDPDEIALFRNSWMSDHPALFNMFVKVGRLIGEDSPPQGGGASPKTDPALARFPVNLT